MTTPETPASVDGGPDEGPVLKEVRRRYAQLGAVLSSFRIDSGGYERVQAKLDVLSDLGEWLKLNERPATTRDAALREEGRADARVMLIANETGDLLTAAREEGRVQERADVVAWLRERARACKEDSHLGGEFAQENLGRFSELWNAASDLEHERMTARHIEPTPDAPQGSAPGDEVAALKQRLSALADERDDYRHHFEACERDRLRQFEELQKARAALAAAPQGSPLPGGVVPRGHCNRCERCGWEVSDERGRCRRKDCSMRPMPPPRTHCAGCGAVFDDVVTPGNPPEGGALEGEMAEALRVRVRACAECGGGQCLLCADSRALLARYDASKAIPQSGDAAKEGT